MDSLHRVDLKPLHTLFKKVYNASSSFVRQLHTFRSLPLAEIHSNRPVQCVAKIEVLAGTIYWTWENVIIPTNFNPDPFVTYQLLTLGLYFVHW